LRHGRVARLSHQAGGLARSAKSSGAAEGRKRAQHAGVHRRAGQVRRVRPRRPSIGDLTTAGFGASDPDADDADVVYVGSASVLHQATGLT
jgi:hypothetical protein